MAYTKEELVTLGAVDIQDARSKIVGINVFDNIDDIKLTSSISGIFSYTYELYLEYLDLLQEFSKTNKEQVLKSLKNIEVIDNHSVERESPDLLRNYSETHHSTAINYFIKKLITEKISLNDFILKKAHEILMRGTSNENEVVIGYRKNNNQFVGYYDEDKRHILYYPISYDEIPRAMDLFFLYYNSPISKEEDLFIKPFVIHGLLAALQVFEDGNTRLARTTQHLNLFELTRTLVDNSLPLPAIYFSKAYIPYRYQYRDLITQLALNPTNDCWLEWIRFNLRRLEDQLYLNQENLKRTRKL